MTLAATTTRRLPRVPAAGLAAALAVTSVGCTVGAVLLHQRLAGLTTHRVRLTGADLVLATAFPLVAALVIAHQRRNAAGWLLLSTALMGPYLLAGQYAAFALVPGDRHPATAAAAWLSIWGYVPYLVLWGLVPMHVPDGRLNSARWRTLRRVIVGLIALQTGARMFAPINSDAAPELRNPLAAPGGQWLNVVTLLTSFAVVLGAGGCGVVAVWRRLRRSSGTERAQLQWLTFGVICLVGSALLGTAVGGTNSDGALAVGMVLLVASIAIGVVRHRLFDIGTALSRTVVYGLLSAFLLLAYAATVAGAGALDSGRRATYAVVAVVALVAAAARDQVQRLVDRLLFGERRDPYAVLRQVHRRLDLATGPVDALGQLAEGLRTKLKLPYVGVEGVDGRLPAIHAGVASPEVERLPATDRSEVVGALVVAHRYPGERFTASERAALADVAQRAGALLGSASMFHDLLRSREGLVVAREEERRRLRRDLHDSIGPRLAAMAMQLDSLTDRLTSQDAALARRAATLSDQLRETVRDVRHVVEDLRPPALDDLGLVPALRQLFDPYAATVTVESAVLPPLPAATEVAAYRIAAEAVTNALRHSGCRACTLHLRTDGPWLVVEVRDDGRGVGDAAVPGVGLQSIRERASEVGGRLELTDADGGGTTVRARLPLEIA
ncbi:histidine kinase [Planosporangium thailandense]|uniref:histidine kinase n=1 Tax=Planosporangium thailandense TaxID=765197 RepID=UPI00197BB168